MVRALLVTWVVAAGSVAAAAPAAGQAAPAASGSVAVQGQGTPTPAAPDGLAWRNNRLTLTLANGNFTISPIIRIDTDDVSFFDQNPAGGFRSGTDFRRLRTGVHGTFLQDFDYTFIWEFGSRPATANTIFDADIGWSGLGWGTIRAGAFTLQHLPEYAVSSYDLLFMERASITNIAASIASGDTREAIGLEAKGDRWNASLYGSGGVGSTRNSSKERGVVGRAVLLALDQNGMQVQVGLDGAAQFKPGVNNAAASIRLSDYPELRGVTSLKYLDTGSIKADRAYAVGPEAEARLGPVYLEALYQHVGVDVTGDGSRGFDGFYAEAAVSLLGPPRERSGKTGTWSRPKTEGFIDPLAGKWGALELAGRYSFVDLQDAATRGGRQRVWSAGLNWYLSPNLKLIADYETGRIHKDAGDREFQGFGLRAALNL